MDSTPRPTVRQLTDGEIDNILRPIFGKSVDYSQIQIYSCCAAPDASATTIKSTIRFDPGYYSDDFSKSDPVRASVLAHETTHVWQFQNSDKTGYALWKVASESVIGVLFHFNRSWAYQYSTDSNRSFLSYRFEQQGQMVEDYTRDLRNGHFNQDLYTQLSTNLPMGRE